MTTGALPTGTVTFLLTDIEDSTRLWDEAPAEMRTALERHDEIVAKAMARNDGFLHGPRGEGDSHFVVFTRPSDAISAAKDVQLAIAREPWTTPSPLRVRVAVHTGQADLRGGDYYGSDVNRAARIRSLAHGGQTLVSLATATIVEDDLPPDATLHDLGTHNLRGLRRPEQLFELGHPDLPTDSPPLRSEEAVARLPAQLTTFVGRKREVGAVSQLLRSARLITLTGVGGAGKTRLALRVAEESAEAFIDGAWFIDLAPLRDPELVPQAMAAALGVRGQSDGSLVEAVAAHLRTKHALLVLDNCEHVVESSAALVHALLSSCDRVAVLATSREPLRLEAEHLWPVPPLQLQPEDEAISVVRLAHQDAVRLFCERARQSDPHFELTESNAADVVSICRTVEALPLALELAAARMRTFGAKEINDRLTDRLQVLTGTNRMATERHQSLGAAIEWSYNLLDEDERSLFRSSSVFAGGFSIEAIESIASPSLGGAVVDVLERLVDKSMAHAERDVNERPRFHLLETLRVYAEQRLEETGETDELRMRHLAYYLSLAERLAAASESPKEGAWRDRLDGEHDNMRVALGTALRVDASSGLRLGAALGNMWSGRWLPSEGSAWLTEFLELVEARDIPYLDALLVAQHLIWRQARYDSAARLLEGALTLARELDDPLWLARTANTEVLFHTTSGELDRAILASRRAHEIATRLAYPPLLRTSTQNRAFAEVFAELPEARLHAFEALELARRLDVPSETGVALQTFAMACLEAGDLDAAQSAAEERVRINRDHRLSGSVATGLTVLAGVSAARGDPISALRIAGAISALSAVAGFIHPPGYARLYQHWLEPAVDALTADVAEHSRAEGASLTELEAIAYALGESDPFKSTGRLGRSHPLTNRELEVAKLLTSGLTNGQIADKLVLSERTIDAHVEHIRNKLGLRTRAQIAAWVTQQALTKPTDV